MRELIVAVGSLLSVVVMAGATAMTVPEKNSAPADLARVNSEAVAVQPNVEGTATAPRIMRYDVSVTRLNKTPSGQVVPNTAIKGSLEVLERQPAYSQSTTQQAYACPSDDKTRLTSCTVNYGYMFAVESSKVDPVTGKVDAKVTLDVTDLEAMLTHKTEMGDLGEPVLASFNVQQRAELTPGKSMQGVYGDYAYKVTLVEVR